MDEELFDDLSGSRCEAFSFLKVGDTMLLIDQMHIVFHQLLEKNSEQVSMSVPKIKPFMSNI